MKNVLTLVALVCLAGASQAYADTTLQFNPNDIFNYATSDDTRLNQQGTARAIWGQGRTTLDLNATGETGRYYQTYNDGVDPLDRMDDATAPQDLQSVANILDWTASYGHQGVCWMQLFLQGGNASAWGETVVLNSGSMTPSVNGEFGWSASLSGFTPVFQTELGGTPDTWNAISPDANPADELWFVTGDLFVDENGNGVYDAGVDSELVMGQEYTIWFFAKLNNWTYVDAYGNGIGGNPGYIEGTLTATVVPVPAAMLLGVLGLGTTGLRLRKRV